MTRHLAGEHIQGRRVSRAERDALYDDVLLQTWTVPPRGGAGDGQYWIVEKDGQMARPVADPAVQNHLRAVHEREHARLACQEPPELDLGALTLAASRPWIERTRWAVTYSGIRRDLLRRLAAVLSPGGADVFLGPGPSPGDPDLWSPRQDEQKLYRLMGAVQRVLDRCDETVRHTGHGLLRWLQSTQPHACCRKPFTLVSLPTTKKKYWRLFQRFVVFVFRVFQISSGSRRRLTGIRFTRPQLEQLEAIWEHEAWEKNNLARSGWAEDRLRRGRDNAAADDDETDDDNDNEDNDNDEEDGEKEKKEEKEEKEKKNSDADKTADENAAQYQDGEEDEEEKEKKKKKKTEIETEIATATAEDSFTSQLLELIFQLSIIFSTQRFIDGQAASSLLVYFSDVLGISADAQRFLPAKNYTPYLSGLIYVQRFLFLEYALSFRVYSYLRILRRQRYRQYQRLNIIRQRYMITGSESALDEFLSLRDYRRVIARTDPPFFLLRWSDNDETVFYGNEFSVTISRVRNLAEYFLLKAEILCTSLLFGLNPAVNLTKVKDDMTNT
jgi:hypothetical protein